MANTSSYDIVNGNRVDNSTDNTTYVFSPSEDLKTFTLAGNSDGDTVAIDASSSDFKVRLKKNEMTLIGQKNTPSAGVVVKVQLDKADGGATKLAFLDGTVNVSFTPNAPGSTKGSWDFGGITGKKKLDLGSESISYTIDGTKTYAQAYADADRIVNAQTIGLTVDSDVLTGGSGDDVFVGYAGNDYDNQFATANGMDVLDGGEGRDTLRVALYESDDDPGLLPQTTSIEVLEVTVNYDDAYSVAGMQGLEEIRMVNNFGNQGRDAEFVGLSTVVDTAIVNSNQDLWLRFGDGALAGDADEMTLTLDRARNSNGYDAELEVDTEDDEKLEILNIVSTGTEANEIDLDIEDGLQELNISGTADLEIDWIYNFGTIGSINATGSFDLTMELDLNSNRESFEFSGTNGANIITIGEDSAYDADDNGVEMSIAAGSGANDVLVIYDDNDVSEDVADIYSGFETLRVIEFADDNGEDAYDLSHLGSDFKAIELVYDNNNNYDDNEDVEVVVGAGQADAIFLIEADGNYNFINGSGGADSNINLELTLDDASGSDDTMKITMVNTDTNENDDSALFGEDLTIDDVESITLHSTGAIEDYRGNEQFNAFDDLFLDGAEELTITGDVSFDVYDDINANDLELVIATGFTGESLDLGEIDVDGDFEYRGSATAHQELEVEAEGDIEVTTGSGDDAVEIDGDNNNWSSAIVNVGSGDDRVHFDMNDNVDDNTVAEVTLGNGEDVLALYDAIDADDTDNDATYVVEVTDFKVADDTIEIDADANGIVFETATVLDSDYDVSGLVDAEETVVIEFSFAADNNDLDFAELYADGNLDGADLLEAIGFDLGDGVITVDNNSDGYLIAYNGGDAYLFTFEDDSSDGTVDADEISLIGVFSNVAVGGFTADHFAEFGGDL